MLSSIASEQELEGVRRMSQTGRCWRCLLDFVRYLGIAEQIDGFEQILELDFAGLEVVSAQTGLGEQCGEVISEQVEIATEDLRRGQPLAYQE